MGLAISEEHQALARVVRSFVEAHGGRAGARATLDAGRARLPAFWSELTALGWLGLHIPEAQGGQGFGFLELAIVLEELGRAVAPGPFLSTALAAATMSRFGNARNHDDVVPSLAIGTRTAGVGLHGSLSRHRDGTLQGSAGLVLGGDMADVLVLAAGEDLVVVDRQRDGLTVHECDNLDPSRRVVRIDCASVRISPDDVLSGARGYAVRIGRVLAAAEAAGGARACTEMATEYAKERVQFGRAIGSFQAVKHHCANMLVAAELATATAWDAARSFDDDDQGELAAAVAATIALPAYVHCARLNIQLHGGIGFTWEHDAHLYLRRAGALAATFGRAEECSAAVARLAQAGVTRTSGVDLPREGEPYRTEARQFVARYRALPESQQHGALVESGYLVPHWPKPWGRAADAVEQIVIDEELADIARPNLGISGWVTLTLAQNGTPDQVDRWIHQSLTGGLLWCQLFSEPGAGSDAAAISTRGTRVEGGWLVNGQKVWTSGAQHADRGLATVRTDVDAPKHAGITMMAIDMKAPGVEVRPLREITGNSAFNEVFFDDVFVPDDDIVGEVGGGWKVARSTFGNERVAIGAGFGDSTGRASELLALLAREGVGDLGFECEVGELLAEESAMQLLTLRQVERALAGTESGPEGNVGKLLAAEHSQRIAELGMRLLGAQGAALDTDESRMAYLYLFTPGLTIAGGTSEIVRNQIAERILGLPRDPLTS